MGYKVGLTEAACDDLGAAVQFLAEKNPEVALRLGDELLRYGSFAGHHPPPGRARTAPSRFRRCGRGPQSGLDVT
jgi:hypothetical protein